MPDQQINRLSARVILVLSVTALCLVAIGYTQPPLPDEGTLAHLFQFSVVALGPTLILFLATADWQKPRRSARPLLVPAAALALAFAALYYLEHYWYS